MPISPYSQWYCTRGTHQIGPFPFATMRDRAASGHLVAGDLVWTEGMDSWTPMCQLPMFQSIVYFGGANAPPSNDPLDSLAAAARQESYAGQYYTPNYSDDGYRSSRRRGESHQGMAIAGFVLSFVFPLLGLIFSIVALSGMKKARNDEGKGLATAGLVISLVFFVVGCIWLLIVFSFVGSLSHHHRTVPVPYNSDTDN